MLDDNLLDSEILLTSEVNQDNNSQDIELGSKKPLKTLLLLSIGPFLFNFVCSIYGFIETWYFSKAFGDTSLAILGAVFPMVIMASLFPSYIGSGYGIQTGYLFGQKKPQEAAQLYIDHLRICFIASILFGILIFYGTIPLCMALGASKELAEQGKLYMLPYGFGYFGTLLFTITCNLYLAVGKSGIFGLSQLGSSILNQGIIAPFLLFIIKTPIWGSLLSTQLSNGIFGLILTIPIFLKKTDYQPNLKMFIQPFSSETKTALIIGIPSLINVISRSCTPMLFQKYLTFAAKIQGISESVLMVWGINNKIQYAVMSFTYTFTAGYIPCASYAHGANRISRLLKLGIHGTWLSTLFTGILSLIIIFYVKNIASLWSKDINFLNTAESILPIFHYTIFLQGIQTMAETKVMTLQLPIRASMMSIFSYGLPIIIFSTLMFKIKNNNTEWICKSYNITDIWCSIMSIILIYNPIKNLWNENNLNFEKFIKND